MTIERRRTGWLTKLMHRAVREALLHRLHRHSLICPVYCLMPDHGHFLLGGLKRDSDQALAARFFRKEWNRLFALRDGGYTLQKQPHDHVLKQEERERGAFESISHYILENPARAGLADNFSHWPYLGSLAAGYPDLDPRTKPQDEFGEKFWKIYRKSRDWENT